MRSLLVLALVACGTMPMQEDGGAQLPHSYACTGFVTCRADGGTAIVKMPYAVSRCGETEADTAALERDSGVPTGCTKSAACELGGDAGC